MSVVRILAGGDLCPGDHYFTLGHGTGTRIRGGTKPFRKVETILQSADLRIANLEGPIAGSSKHECVFEANAFRGPPGAERMLRQAGWDVLHVANNHITQHGDDALRECLARLSDVGIIPLGLATEEGGCVPVVLDINGLRLGLLGYSFVQERYTPGQKHYAAPTPAQSLREIKALGAQTDAVIVSVHWGQEGEAYPDSFTVQLADDMVAAGATTVLGHHPHVLQPVVSVGRSIIAYSLGNLLFDLFWDRRLVEGALLTIDINKHGVTGHRVWPVVMGSDYTISGPPDPESGKGEPFIENHSNVMREDAPRHPPSAPGGVTTQGKKLFFFLRNFHRGDSLQKGKFLMNKINTVIVAAFARARRFLSLGR